MYEVFADLHVHIGRSENNKPIKITAARSLNFANIAKRTPGFSGAELENVLNEAAILAVRANKDKISVF